MPLFDILIVLTALGGVILCLVATMRLFAYNKKYHLPESQYTKLFRIITKEHLTMVYVIFVVSYTVFTIWFLITL